MARIYPLFSSSSGNAHFIGTPAGGILIDAGVSCKKLVSALRLNGIEPEAVRAIFITHDHSDHINGLRVFGKCCKAPVYATLGTLKYLDSQGILCSLKADVIGSGGVDAAGFHVTAFHTPHDAAESVGYRIHTPDGKICSICTDLGHITEEVDRGISGCGLVLLESNYDDNMLKSGPYPYSLKKRIASLTGHLSNTESAREARRLIESGTRRIILGHLSRENNTPRLAEETLIKTLGSELVRNRDYMLTVAPVETSGLSIVF